MTGQLLLPEDYGGTPAVKKFHVRSARAYAEGLIGQPEPEPEPISHDEGGGDGEPDDAA
ncbi:MAG: hypothetical protein QM699_06845 [Amaricoccus sp.]|uniref:hypothetical protein n=1 Tax=Amaricoccus sp. TaxID=1872485 RepID=UPI0039E3719A